MWCIEGLQYKWLISDSDIWSTIIWRPMGSYSFKTLVCFKSTLEVHEHIFHFARPIDVYWGSMCGASLSSMDVHGTSMRRLIAYWALLIVTSVWRPFWTSMDVRFGRTSFVSFGTSCGRPLDVHFGRPLVCFGRPMDVYATSFCPLGSAYAAYIKMSLKKIE